MKDFLSQAEFVSFPKEVREKLREVFGIPKSGHVRVENVGLGVDRVVSDGTEPQDLLATLNTNALLKFLGAERQEGAIYGFDVLFGQVLAKLFPTDTPKIMKEEPVVEVPKVEVKEEEKVAPKIVVSQKKRATKKK